MRTRGVVRLLITDLDNTLYDWVTFFVPAFYAMVRKTAELIDVSEDVILDSLRTVHQLHGSSEHPFALLEAKAVTSKLEHLTPKARLEFLQPAFYAFNKERKNALTLYPTVSATLDKVRSNGAIIVAYTDARVENSLFRLVRLGVMDVITRLYAPRHRIDLPPRDPAPEYAKSVPENFVKLLPPEDRKPNPNVLLDICRDFGVAPSDTLYIGDSLVRDIYMANTAGVHSAWARYGTHYDKTLWPKLVRATHWTDADVANEHRLRSEIGNVTAEVELASFSDVLTSFEFTAPKQHATA